MVSRKNSLLSILPAKFNSSHGGTKQKPPDKQGKEMVPEDSGRYAALVNSISGIVWEANPALCFTFVSQGAESLLGYPLSNWLEQRDFWVNHIHPDDRERAIQYCQDAIAQRQSVEFEYRMIGADGRMIWLQNLLSIAEEPDQLVTLRGVMFDISKRKEMEEALRKNEEISKLLAMIVEQSSDAVFCKDPKGVITYWNSGAERLYGWTAEEAVGRSLHQLQRRDLDGQSAELLAHRTSANSGAFEARHYTKSGNVLDVGITTTPLFDKRGTRTLEMTVTRDITEQKRLEEQLRLAANALENTAEAIIICDVAKRIVSVNKAFSAITQYAPEEAIGRTPEFLRSSEHDQAFYALLWEQVAATGRWQGELWGRRKNGEIYPQWISIAAVEDSDGQISHYVSVSNDISKYQQYEQRLEFLAHHDALTRLPNRALLCERLQQSLRRARRYKRVGGVLSVNLDGFKTINDTFGHPVGDQLLQAVAERLRAAVRASDTVSRREEDHFTILLDEIRDPQDARKVAQNLFDRLSKPFHLGEHEVLVSACIGIVCHPEDGNDPDTLLANADIALRQAKEMGRNCYQFYSAEMNTRLRETLILADSLRSAVERKEFLLYYKPRVELSSGRLTAMEVLLRWRHPERGLLSPAEFMRVAEESGMIVPIGEWVLRTACYQAKAWMDSGLPPVRIVVNLSAYQFKSEELAEHIAGILRETGFNPSHLEVEITESMATENRGNAEAMLTKLGDLGITIAIDDFGTDYSSLKYLKRFPIHALKLDQSLIQGLPDNPDDVAITMAIIGMAKSLTLDIVAEGIETLEQSKLLQSLGCREGLGSLFGSPGPAENAELLLKRNFA